MSNSKRTLLAAGAALAIVGTAGALLMRGPRHELAPSSRDASRGGDAALALPLADAAGADGEKFDAKREAEAERGDLNGAEAPRLPRPGFVHLKVVDARTQAELEHVRVKFLSETRFAESGGDREITARLTAGAWEASVSATGFEPARLGPFEVKPGETLELGAIALGRGTGVIEGQVIALHLDRDRPVVVQLYGDGRSPCDRCLGLAAQPPVPSSGEAGAEVVPFGSDCAYGDARDELTLQGGGAFRFEHLAAGVYWLRACDATQRIVESRRLELGRGGRLWQELDVSAPTKARFELRHKGGGLFTGAWSAIHRASPASIHYEFRRRGRVVGGVDVAPTVDDCLASVGPPIAIPGREPAPLNLAQGRYTVRFFQSSIRISPQIETLSFDRLVVSRNDGGWVIGQVSPSDEEARDDRPRADGDGLLVDCGEPEVESVALQAKALRPDLHEVEPLPRTELSVVVSCGNYRSDELPIDLHSDPFQPFVIAMKLEPDLESRRAEIRKDPPASCVACHDNESPTDGKVNYGQQQIEVSFDLGDQTGAFLNFEENVVIRLGDMPTVDPQTPAEANPEDGH